MYGSITAPTDLGSGGNSSGRAAGGAGGGAIRLTVAGTLTVDGSLTANGNAGVVNCHAGCRYGRGGSGGSVYVTAGGLAGTGLISANGGDASNANKASGGGGGRIAIYYDTNTYSGTMSADGGSANGGAGTIYSRSASQVWGDLLIDNSGQSGVTTPLLDGTYTFDSVEVINQGKLEVPPNAVLRLASDILTLHNSGEMIVEGEVGQAGAGPGEFTQVVVTTGARLTLGASFCIVTSQFEVSSDAVVTLNDQSCIASSQLNISSGGMLTLNDESDLDIPELEVLSGGVLVLNKPETLTNMHIASGGVLTRSASLAGFDLTVTGDLTVDEGASILADGKGYGSDAGPGAWGGSGGSYGGKGGGWGGPVYGSITAPSDLGSGGSSRWGAPGGAGGGAIRLTVAGTLTIDGILTANGNVGGYGGSGGSVYVTVGELTGTGLISAEGGARGNSSVAGGGGGRIAIYYDTDTYGGLVSASGGAVTGGAGTIYSKSAGQEWGDLLIDRGWWSEATTPLPDGTHTFDSVEVINEGKLEVPPNAVLRIASDILTLHDDGEMIVEGEVGQIGAGPGEFTQVVVTTGARLTLGASFCIFTSQFEVSSDAVVTLNDQSCIASSQLNISSRGTLTLNDESGIDTPEVEILSDGVLVLNRPETFTNMHIGSGGVLTHSAGLAGLDLTVTGDLTVDPGASILADGKGYGSDAGPGAGVAASGGSYGGKGGGQSGPLYGSITAPTDLGSGGGLVNAGWGNRAAGGAGGGAIHLTVGGRLTVDGSLRADGNDGAHHCWLWCVFHIYAGGGSGGSIYVMAGELAGTGVISADGGDPGGGSAGGGGGGRVAIYYLASIFSGDATVFGGNGQEVGEDGTIVLLPVGGLSETAYTESTLTESLLVQRANLDGAIISGDLNGTLSFTSFELVSITTGPFAGQGFSTGRWQTVLEGATFDGDWKGVLSPDHAGGGLHLKGAVSGDMLGTVEGYVGETVPGSGLYDQYEATWKVTRPGDTVTSMTLGVAGNLDYEEGGTEIPGAELLVVQASFEGDLAGDYTGPLSAFLTHVRVIDGAPYNGQAFSIISYVSESGAGTGWTYDEVASSGLVEMHGLFDAPLYGVVYGALLGSDSPRTLTLAIQRIDLGLPPMADLQVAVWGQRRVSPGETIDYIVEYRNDGLLPAEDVVIVDTLPSQVTYVSSTGEGAYNAESHQVTWHLGAIPPKAHGTLSISVSVVWGLPGISFENIVSIPVEPIRIEIDPTAVVTFETLDATEDHVAMNATVSGEFGSGVIELEASLADVPEMREPTLEYYEELGEVTITLRYTVEDPSTLRLMGEASSTLGITEVTASLKGPQEVIGALASVPAYHDIYQSAETTERFLGWLEEKGYIREKDHAGFTQGKDMHADGKSLLPWATWTLDKFARWAFKGVGPGSTVYNSQLHDAIQHHTLGAKTLEEAEAEYRDDPEVFDASGAYINDVVPARDPNIKYGPEGAISPGQELEYKVEYENEGEGIAFGVYFTDTLDEDLDDSTLDIGPVISTLDGSVIAAPGTYAPATRTITWLVGEVGPGEGGYAEISVEARADAPNGTEIINYATVYFPSVPEVTRTNGVVSIVSTDLSAPTTTISPEPASPDGEDGWYVSPVTVTLIAEDDLGGSGVASTEYRLDGGIWQEYVGPFTLSADGTTLVEARSTDNAGNVEDPPVSATVKIDQTPPAVTISGLAEGAEYDNEVVPSVAVADITSGIATSTVHLDGVPWDGSAIVDRGPHTFTAEATDSAGNSSTTSVSFTIYWTTSLTASDATVQYSDSMGLEAILTNHKGNPVGGAALTYDVPGACGGTAVTDASGIAIYVCGPIDVPAGSYPVAVSFAQDDVGYLRASASGSVLTVSSENAIALYENLVAELVEQPGGDADFALTVQVNETYPEPEGGSLAWPGDIGRADVSITLVPVGPGSPQSASCSDRSMDGTGYDRTLTATCSFLGVDVNTYSVLVTVNGGYYTAETEDVLVVYDPSLGFTTGGGRFYWPETEDPASGYPGDKTNFGFTIKYNKKGANVRGSLLVIRHLPDGTIYRLKSNALDGLALGEFEVDGETLGWASFSGKATYLEPGWLDPVGNYKFVAYAEDRTEPGSGIDCFWLQVRDKDRVLLPAMSMDAPAIDNCVQQSGGNIVVPHKAGGRSPGVQAIESSDGITDPVIGSRLSSQVIYATILQEAVTRRGR